MVVVSTMVQLVLGTTMVVVSTMVLRTTMVVPSTGGLQSCRGTRDGPSEYLETRRGRKTGGAREQTTIPHAC